MIELIILNYLKNTLTVPVGLERPEPLPSRFVMLEKTGSGRSNHLKTSTFAFQSYAETLHETVLLNQKVMEAVDSLIELDAIGSVRLNSDYNFTDTTTKRYRYQAVYDIAHY